MLLNNPWIKDKIEKLEHTLKWMKMEKATYPTVCDITGAIFRNL